MYSFLFRPGNAFAELSPVLGGSALRRRCDLRFRLLGRHDMACAAVASARVWGVHFLASAMKVHPPAAMGRLERR